MPNRLYHVNDAVATGLASNEDISDPVCVPIYAFLHFKFFKIDNQIVAFCKG